MSVLDLPARLMEKRVKLDVMVAHKGECLYCQDSRGLPGLVKMSRNQNTLDLQPEKCRCLNCGQAYFMKIDDIKKWEHLQWQQKSQSKG